jgi:hypothetical protein
MLTTLLVAKHLNNLGKLRMFADKTPASIGVPDFIDNRDGLFLESFDKIVFGERT